MKRTCLNILAMVAVVLSLAACNDFLDIQPIGKVMPQTGDEYRKLLTEAYSRVLADRGLTTFRTDELVLDDATASDDDLEFYLDIWRWQDNNPDQNTSSFGWLNHYYVSYIANSVIENRQNIIEVTDSARNQMVGEAYMLRAYIHYILVNLYADPYTHCDPATTKGIPLKLSSDVTAVLSRNTVGEVYASILSDIDMAESLLNVETWPEGETYRFNKVSADAFRARVCLYMGNWEEAYKAAVRVIERHGTLEDMTSSTTLPNDYQSVEAIVSLENIITENYNTGKISDGLVALYRSGDMRLSRFYRQQVAGVYMLRKGGNNTYRCTFRTAEFYLTAAEAAVELNDMDNARHYLTELMKKRYNALMYSRYEPEILAMTRDELRQEIYDERFRELAFEGHRWFDLRRTTRPELTKTYNGETYVLQKDDPRYTLRIPPEAVEANPGLEAE